LLYSMVLQGRAELSLAPDEYAGLVMVLLRFLAFPAQGGGMPRPPPARVPSQLPASPATAPSAALKARSTERARAPVPAIPAVTPPAMADSVPATRASPAKVSDEPPPWMDEAPFDDEPAFVAAPVPEPVALPLPATTSPAPHPTIELTRTPLGDRWSEVVAALVAGNAVMALVRELAMQAQLTAIDLGADGAERWHLRVERETLRAPALADKLQAALVAHTGAALRLEISAGEPQDSPARRDSEAAAERQRVAEQIIHSDPLVQAMLAQFSTARIVPGSIRPA
jgi:DNA polymerase-3 subunit gamma/tau